jgi:hypothetical protein
MKKLIAANLISGLSLVTLIVFGVQYLIFKNTPVYENYSIEIINNPITGNDDIQFAMSGQKMLDCQAHNVYGIAYGEGKEIKLDQYTKAYIRNVTKGENVLNAWSYRKPEELTTGVYHVTMFGDWDCRFWIFNETSTRSYDNILLVVN